MEKELSRTAILIGEKNVEILKNSKVIVFGVGGVGSFAVESLARCGLSRLDVVDSDIVSLSNINRQIIALHSTVGKKKVDVIKERILDISPNTVVDAYDCFFDSKTVSIFDFSKYDYVVDAIDSMESKLLLIKTAKSCGVPIISALSSGNKMDLTRFKVSDIFSTSVCPIAKILRKRLKEENIASLKVVYSDEIPIKSNDVDTCEEDKRNIGSISFVPSCVGLIIAKSVICDLINFRG